MEGEGLVLVLIAVHEVQCLCCRVLCRFIVALSLHGLVIVSSFHVLAVVALSWHVFIIACCWHVVMVCPYFMVVVLHCVIFCALVPSFDGQVAWGC